MLTKHRDIVHAQTVSCLGRIAHWYRAHAQMEAVAEATPLIATSGSNFVCNGDVLALLERFYRTTDRYDKQQTSPLASLEARWLAPAPA